MGSFISQTCSAGGSYTELAIPALLTGRIYDNSEPKESFLSAAYLNDSIFARLKRSGVRVDIYPWGRLGQ